MLKDQFKLFTSSSMIHKYYKKCMKEYDCDEYTTIKNFQVFVSYFFKNAIKSETNNCCCIQQLGRDKKQNNNILYIL